MFFFNPIRTMKKKYHRYLIRAKPTSSPGLFFPPIFRGKSPGDEVGAKQMTSEHKISRDFIVVAALFIY